MTKTGCPGPSTCFILLVILLTAGCGGSVNQYQTSDISPNEVISAVDPVLPGGAVMPFCRLAADAGDDFTSQRDGCEFAADLPNNRCSPAAQTALFDPQWMADASNVLEDAAYCLYRLKMYAPDGKATLKLAWYYDPPNAGSCWVGIPDWSRQAWLWQVLPDTNEIALGDPAAYGDADLNSYAVVIVLDHRASALASIGYGAEPPPPPQYNLYAPMQEKTTYLVDMEGNVVHTWESEYYPAASVYLLDNGNLLRTSILPTRQIHFAGGGGRIEEFDWDGEVVWSYELSSSTSLLHHDIEPMPNGHILAVAWDKHTAQEMIDLGRNPDSLSFGSLFVDGVIEIEPLEGGGGQIVWEWRLIDHLVQDFDPEKAGYDPVSSHPELVDVNYSGGGTDWTHINSIDYNAELDQIVLSVHGFDELWIIDHGTTTEEAASHEGGLRGRGGDLLYRWGNPKTYIRSATSQQKCYGQHDVQWIPEGYPGAGHLLLFNNRFSAPPDPDWPYSSVLEVVPPLNAYGCYDLQGYMYGPAEAAWEFHYDPPTDMFSSTMSGCQRLPNGNTLVCCAETGWVLEAKADGEVVWDYDIGVNVFRATRLSWDYSGLARLEAPPE